ncbi:MAG: hypothetical protein Q7U66_14195 [Methylobacter sp.]|nr:hypothetical protein [Methylobacter sp.]
MTDHYRKFDGVKINFVTASADADFNNRTRMPRIRRIFKKHETILTNLFLFPIDVNCTYALNLSMDKNGSCPNGEFAIADL